MKSTRSSTIFFRLCREFEIRPVEADFMSACFIPNHTQYSRPERMKPPEGRFGSPRSPELP